MSMIPLDVRKRVVKAYKEGKSGTYAQTAELFGVGEASLSRWLRKDREGASLEPGWNGGPKRRVDLEWLTRQVEENPDARIVDRIDAWQAHDGYRVSVGAMWNALRAAGLTHKKRRR
jgi:transposase